MGYCGGSIYDSLLQSGSMVHFYYKCLRNDQNETKFCFMYSMIHILYLTQLVQIVYYGIRVHKFLLKIIRPDKQYF